MEYKQRTFQILRICYLSIASIVICAIFGMLIIYPNNHHTIIKKECAANNIDYNFCKAIIWTESKYNTNAISKKGAVGLMQLLPSTASWIVKINHTNNINPQSTIFNNNIKENNIAKTQNINPNTINTTTLKKPQTNVHIGVLYLKYLQDKFKDQTTMLAAYNAGEGNIKLWLRDTRYSKDQKTIYNTPFSETNNYIKRVFKAQKIYSFLYGK